MNYEEILDRIDDVTSPAAMTKEEALEFLQEISGGLVGRIEALQNEIEEEEA